MKSVRFYILIGAFLLSVALLFSIGGKRSFAQSGNDFVHETSSRSFHGTISALKRAISENGMMIAGGMNQKRILSMTGLYLKGARSFFVGNPVFGKKLFAMNPAVGAVVPFRIYVWVNHKGNTEVGYFKPSSHLAEISPMMKMAGSMLDRKIAMMVHAATH